MHKTILLLFLLFLSVEAFSQSANDLETFNQQRLNINRTGMIILGAWGAGNLLSGAVLSGRRTGVDQYFHQMNMGWGAVNLVLAGVSYYSALKAGVNISVSESIQEQQFIEKILLLNAGLDIAYMATGIYLKERSNRYELASMKNQRFEGFGRSLILQGAFLFCFDVALYFIHHTNFNSGLLPILGNISLGANSIGLRWML